MIQSEVAITSFNDLFLYLDDIKEYVNSFLLYYYGNDELDIEEIICALSTINDIVESIKLFISQNIV